MGFLWRGLFGGVIRFWIGALYLRMSPALQDFGAIAAVLSFPVLGVGKASAGFGAVVAPAGHAIIMILVVVKWHTLL